MADFAIQQDARAETVERIESRFEQKGSKAFYGDQDIFLYPAVFGSDGTVSFDVSRTVWQHGIQTPLYLSASLYFQWILNAHWNPVKTVAALCHAFLYQVDMDNEGQRKLSFTFPVFSPFEGIIGIPVRATISGFRSEYIYIESDQE